MSQPLSSAHRLAMRKELVRLRLEMHRQQARYHAQPLIHPLEQLKGLWNRPGSSIGGKTPLAMGGAVLLTLFGKRLGIFGRVARIALAVYPLISAWRATQHQDTPPQPLPRPVSEDASPPAR